MSCYTRHLDEFLPREPTSPDRFALDEAVRTTLGMAEADCPEVWAKVKERRDDAAFTNKVRAAVQEYR